MAATWAVPVQKPQVVQPCSVVRVANEDHIAGLCLPGGNAAGCGSGLKIDFRREVPLANYRFRPKSASRSAVKHSLELQAPSKTAFDEACLQAL